jgi:protein O-mannosyl-transferase
VKTRRWGPAVALVVLALAATATGIHNQWALDDFPIILNNGQAHDLAHVWMRFGETYWPAAYTARLYRPLTMALFNFEWAIDGASPVVFHTVSILLFVGVVMAVYAMARRLLPPVGAWWAAAAFAVHPVHAEAIGNAVGQGELLAALLFVTTMWWYLRCRAGGATLTRGQLMVLGVLYLAGVLAKEHAITLPAVVVMAELTVLADGRPWREKLNVLGVLGGVGVGYLVVRRVVIGNTLGDTPILPLQHISTAERLMTFLGCVPQWVRLLVWPQHLVAVYSPPEFPVRLHLDAMVVLGLFLLLAIGALAVAVRRVAPVVSFGVAWLAIVLLPASNLLFATGIILAERTLFLPSVGFALVAGVVAVIVWNETRSWQPSSRTIGAVAAAALVVVAVKRSAERQLVWRDGLTLFSTTAADAPESYVAHFSYGSLLFRTQGAKERVHAEQEAWIALGLYQDDPVLVHALGLESWRDGRCVVAEPLFRRTLELAPAYFDARVKLVDCLMRRAQWSDARAVVNAGIERGPNRDYFRGKLVAIDSAVAVK